MHVLIDILYRRPMLHRDTLMAAAAIYKGNLKIQGEKVLIVYCESYIELHGNPDGTIPATFEIIYMVNRG